MNGFADSVKRSGVLACLLVLWATAPLGASILGEGSELELGGPGSEPGKLLEVRDLVFDTDNHLVVLEGFRWEGKTRIGNGRVQVFTSEGKLLRAYSLLDLQPGDKNEPTRLAVDSRGHFFITQPRAGLVQELGPDGKAKKSHEIPGAHAIAVRKYWGREQVLVIPNVHRDNRNVEVNQVVILENGTRLPQPLKLSHPVQNCQLLRCDAEGCLYLQAHQNQVYKLDPEGKLLKVLGGGTMLRTDDGSELNPALAIDSQGRLYSNTYGNPSHISRFSRDLKQVTQREGQFAWADSWGENSLLAIDRKDRLWVAALGSTPGNERYHYRPCVLRVQPDFFDPAQPRVTTHGTELLGLHLAAECRLPYGITYELKPVSFELVVKPSNRQVHHLDVKWLVHDIHRREIARGSFPLPLVDGKEARHSVSFTPPRWGWYTVSFEAWQGERRLLAVGRHLGATPKLTSVPTLASGESAGGWNDPARQAFAGLLLYRVHTNEGLDRIEREVKQAAKYGLTLLVQLENEKACAPEQVRAAVTRYKGQVKYWEVINEPNLTMPPEKYLRILREVSALIRSIDPEARVVGPTVCGIQLPWYEAFYRLGGKELVDILSIHDYEGNEAIDPDHWRWKIGRLRRLMARHGDEKKPIWQTERAIGGVRAGNFLPGVQAVRVLLHMDLLEELGIPGEHDLHYYLNQGGYSTVPTYVWSDAGPHPAALATRIRQALIHGRHFAGRVDFGPSGNKLFQGLRYDGPDGSTLTLRNLGTLPTPLELDVAGGSGVRVVDAFGNEDRLAVKNGKVSVRLTPLPTYLRLQPGQTACAPTLDFGRNYATQATFTYSAKHGGDLARLTNGIFEVSHPGSPFEGIWSGELPRVPQTLEMRFPHPRLVDRVLVFSMRADNPYCALLDYDLEYHDGRSWVTLEEVRTPVPASDAVNTPDCKATTWYRDENFFVHHFRSISTDRLRLVVYRTTHGFMPDAMAEKAAGWSANAPHLMLREIEIYGPPAAVEARLSAASTKRMEAFTREPLTLHLTGHSGEPSKGQTVLRAPRGWTVSPSEVSFALSGKETMDRSFQLRPPPGPIPAGALAVKAALFDSHGELIDFDVLHLEMKSPVQVAVAAPGRLDSKQQPIPLQLRNVSDRPVQGTIEIEARPDSSLEGEKRLRVQAPFGPVPAGEGQTVAPEAAGLDLLAGSWQLRYTVIASGVSVQGEAKWSQVRSWQVLGPFPNLTGRAFDVDFGPEKGADPGRSYAREDGQTLHWKTARTSTSGYLDFTSVFQPNILGCAYALGYIKSPRERQALVSTGSDDGARIWLNGEQILARPGPRSAAPGQDRVAVRLRAGWNEVLLKVPQSHGGWGFYFEILDPEGRPLTDLAHAAKRRD